MLEPWIDCECNRCLVDRGFPKHFYAFWASSPKIRSGWCWKHQFGLCKRKFGIKIDAKIFPNSSFHIAVTSSMLLREPCIKVCLLQYKRSRTWLFRSLAYSLNDVFGKIGEESPCWCRTYWEICIERNSKGGEFRIPLSLQVIFQFKESANAFDMRLWSESGSVSFVDVAKRYPYSRN